MNSPRKKPILLVNPWIHDFAAYDLWMKPLGLLYVGSILRSKGYAVSLLDCLELSSFPEAGLRKPKKKESGRGHFYKEVIAKPEALGKIPRRYRRYGVPPGMVKNLLRRLPRPDLVLVTSSMTYWYPGVVETVQLMRECIPGVPIFLGGIYATLCPDHAQRISGVDRVLPGPWDEEKLKIVAEILGDPGQEGEEGFLSWPYPAFDLYPQLSYVCVLTRSGCPFSCTYCASHRLARDFESRNPEEVIGELEHWHKKFGVKDFAFYDDALLIRPDAHILPILRGVMGKKLPCRFHVPNALHAKAIEREVADSLYRAGFKTIRLGFETSNETLQSETGGKVNNQDLRRAVDSLKKAGYSRKEIGVYLVAGLPGQRLEEVEDSITFVKAAGARPILVEYSPIPGTALFEKARRMSPFDLEEEPLFQNNSLLPCRWEGFSWENFQRLKENIKEPS
ncbi:MAG: Fe-S oxidoreductase [Deltaproteobacteria bacterium]|nr:Fe-S oxidoreductase [Deltaproteobacteria bacterium]